MSILEHFFKEHLEYDFFKLMCGEKIGAGYGREVWSFGWDDQYVIKLEGNAHSFQNILEWDLWHRVKSTEDKDLIKWLAPCEMISPRGDVLIQRRTKTLPKNEYPDKIPSFLTDTKYSNYGMLNGKFVCHDYGTHCLQVGGLSKRLYSIKWKDEPV